MALLKRIRERLAFWLWYLTQYKPIAGADGDDGGDGGEGEGAASEDGDDKGGSGGAGDEDDEGKVGADDDWKTKARKHESRAKRERKAREEAEARARKAEEANQSEAEKAVAEAERKGREAAESEAAKERKADRLEVAVTRLASKKVSIGTGDDAEEVRFADSEDALIHIERAIARGDIDEADIFDDQGRVDTDALQSELGQLLERKPHLREGAGKESSKAPDSDARKGGTAKTDLEAMSPEDHAKRKYGKS